jgi:non-ribosomal peptide synthetase component F
MQVYSTRGVEVCGEALNVIAALSSSGVLAGDRTISKSLADVISRYCKIVTIVFNILMMTPILVEFVSNLYSFIDKVIL